MSGVATTIDCRLLCASTSAYYINRDTGKFCPPQGDPVLGGVGYVQTPVAIVGGLDGALPIDAALVGRNQDDGIIVAYRGTIPMARDLASIVDWMQDVFFVDPKTRNGLPGKVHVGFYDAVQAIWQRVEAEVARLQDSADSVPVYYTGHSKGGPMASISAMLAHGQAGLQPRKVYTFASAKPGNVEFAHSYNNTYQQTSYESYLDLVPFLPPSKPAIELFEHLPLIGPLFKKAEGWDYSPVGERLYIRKDHKIVKDNRFDDIERLGEILLHIGRPETIAEAHCSACQTSTCAGRYMRGVCRSEVCPPSVADAD